MTHKVFQIRSSPIHGQGGFALVRIEPGTVVTEYLGRRIDKQESLRQCELENEYIFCLSDAEDLDGNVAWNPARFFNHSCAPNCEAEQKDRRIYIIANRIIESGEELTFDYGYDLEDWHEHPCCCGAAECPGYIVAQELRSDLRRAIARSLFGV